MPNDLVKTDSTLEYWIKDSLYGISFSDAQIKDLALIMEPLRTQIEDAMKLYDPKIDKWQHFRNALWSAIPKAFENRIAVKINKWLRDGAAKDLVADRKSLD